MTIVGIRDVAERAGVSLSTVSNVLNRPERVSPELQERVREAVATLGYVPNAAASQLRAGRSHTIGMAVINITNPFFADVVLGAEQGADAAGLSVIVGNTYDSDAKQKGYLGIFERQHLDGVLVAPLGNDRAPLERLIGRGIPVVLVDRVDDLGVISSVSLDDVAGGRLAAEHLIGLGRTHLCFVGGRESLPQMRDRLRGFREAIEDAGGVRLTVIDTVTLNTGLGRSIGESLVALPVEERPDAVFSGNDVAALGLLQAFVHAGLDVPGDIALIGYDDIEFASAAVVPLTSIRQPAHEMGMRAAELLVARIGGATTEYESIVFQPELIARASTVGA